MIRNFLRSLLSRLRLALQLSRELNSYTDAELADLGTTREQVAGIAMRAAFPKTASQVSRQGSPSKAGAGSVTVKLALSAPSS